MQNWRFHYRYLLVGGQSVTIFILFFIIHCSFFLCTHKPTPLLHLTRSLSATKQQQEPTKKKIKRKRNLFSGT